MSKDAKTQHATSRARHPFDGDADLAVTIAELYYRAADLQSSDLEAARILFYAAQDLERPGTTDDLQFREAALSDAVLNAIEQALHPKH